MLSNHLGEKAVDAYITQFPEDVQEKLTKIRVLIKGLIPEATEKISYGMPTYKLKENIVHFTAYRKHIGFIQRHQQLKLLEMNCWAMKHLKVLLNFLWTSPFPMI